MSFAKGIYRKSAARFWSAARLTVSGIANKAARSGKAIFGGFHHDAREREFFSFHLLLEVGALINT
jgi:hypothetical protein